MMGHTAPVKAVAAHTPAHTVAGVVVVVHTPGHIAPGTQGVAHKMEASALLVVAPDAFQAYHLGGSARQHEDQGHLVGHTGPVGRSYADMEPGEVHIECPVRGDVVQDMSAC